MESCSFVPKLTHIDSRVPGQLRFERIRVKLFHFIAVYCLLTGFSHLHRVIALDLFLSITIESVPIPIEGVGCSCCRNDMLQLLVIANCYYLGLRPRYERLDQAAATPL